MPRLKTRLTEFLSIDHPVISAPMAFAASGKLAAAVSAGGGLGLIGGGYGDASWLEQAFEEAGNQPVGAGFITWSLAENPSLLDLVLERKPSAMMFSFGDASAFVEKSKSQDVSVICQVQTVAQARDAASWGADIIVAQGGEAGGHGASRGTMPLVPSVIDAVGDRTIVVAAGGIADGRGLAAALSLGAEGALMGSRFYCATEASVDDEAQALAATASGDRTVRSSVIDHVRGKTWPEMYKLRTLPNAYLEKWHGNETGLTQNLEEQQSRYDQAGVDKDYDTRAVIIGEAVDLIHSTEPAADIIENLVSDAIQALRNSTGRIIG
jgi:nitronate monooxygenase